MLFKMLEAEPVGVDGRVVLFPVSNSFCFRSALENAYRLGFVLIEQDQEPLPKDIWVKISCTDLMRR